MHTRSALASSCDARICRWADAVLPMSPHRALLPSGLVEWPASATTQAQPCIEMNGRETEPGGACQVFAFCVSPVMSAPRRMIFTPRMHAAICASGAAIVFSGVVVATYIGTSWSWSLFVWGTTARPGNRSLVNHSE